MAAQSTGYDKDKLEEFTDNIEMKHPNSDLCPLIEKAGQEENKEFVEKLLKQIVGCDLIREENNCTTLLFRSSSKEYVNVDVATYLLKNKTQYLNGDPLDRPDFRRPSTIKPSLLHEATVTDNEDLVRSIIQETIRRSEIENLPDQVTDYINYKDDKGDTALMWAAEGGRVNAARVILEECEKRGADVVKKTVDAVNNKGETALHWAGKKNAVDRAKADEPNNAADLKNRLLVATLLIKHGADVTIKNKASKTALEFYSDIQKLVEELRK